MSKSKLENYLLNINHPVGGSKAKFFINVLGYSHDKPKLFFDNVSDAINGKNQSKIQQQNMVEFSNFMRE